MSFMRAHHLIAHARQKPGLCWGVMQCVYYSMPDSRRDDSAKVRRTDNRGQSTPGNLRRSIHNPTYAEQNSDAHRRPGSTHRPFALFLPF